MSDLTLVEIFFIITGIAVVVITIAVVALVLYILSFVRAVKQVITTVNNAAEIISADAAELRQNLKTKGFNLAALFAFFKSLAKLKNTKGKK